MHLISFDRVSKWYYAALAPVDNIRIMLRIEVSKMFCFIRSFLCNLLRINIKSISKGAIAIAMVSSLAPN